MGNCSCVLSDMYREKEQALKFATELNREINAENEHLKGQLKWLIQAIESGVELKAQVYICYNERNEKENAYEIFTYGSEYPTIRLYEGIYEDNFYEDSFDVDE